MQRTAAHTIRFFKKGVLRAVLLLGSLVHLVSTGDEDGVMWRYRVVNGYEEGIKLYWWEISQHQQRFFEGFCAERHLFSKIYQPNGMFSRLVRWFTTNNGETLASLSLPLSMIDADWLIANVERHQEKKSISLSVIFKIGISLDC